MKFLSYLSPQLIAVFPSKVNSEIKVVEYFGRKAVYVDGVPQSGAEITSMWEKIIKRIKKQELRIKNCLVLGIGGGDVIKIIRKYYKDAEIIGVDNDPTMIDIAKKYFDLDRVSKCKIVISDALDFVKKVKTKFDLIVVDLYLGRLNPQKTREIDFMKNLKKILAAGGLILYNSHYRKDNPSEFIQFLDTCKKIFPKIEEVFAYRNNRVVKLKSHV